MKLSERNIIITQLEVIKGAKNIKVGRAANLIWIAFEGINKKNYAIHLQTFFRFCDGQKVLITDSDKYQPTALARVNPKFDAQNFEWDVQGNNLLDQWVSEFQKILYSLLVETVDINTLGDLEICFNHDITLTVLLDSTSSDECWRFFEWHSKKPHLVITGRGIEDLEEYLYESK